MSSLFHDPRHAYMSSVNPSTQKMAFQSVVNVNGYAPMSFFDYLIASRDCKPLYPAPTNISTFNYPMSATCFTLRDEPSLYNRSLLQDGQFAPLLCTLNGLPRDQRKDHTNSREEKWKLFRNLWHKIVFLGITRTKLDLNDSNQQSPNLRYKSVACVLYGDGTFVNNSDRAWYPGDRIIASLPDPNNNAPIRVEWYENGGVPLMLESYDPKMYSALTTKTVLDYFKSIVQDIDSDSPGSRFEFSSSRISATDIGNTLIEFGMGFAAVVIRHLFYNSEGSSNSNLPNDFQKFLDDYPFLGFQADKNQYYPTERIKLEQASKTIPLLQKVLKSLSTNNKEFDSTGEDLNPKVSCWRRLVFDVLCGLGSVEDQLRAHTVGMAAEYTAPGRTGVVIIRK